MISAREEEHLRRQRSDEDDVYNLLFIARGRRIFSSLAFLHASLGAAPPPLTSISCATFCFARRFIFHTAERATPATRQRRLVLKLTYRNPETPITAHQQPLPTVGILPFTTSFSCNRHRSLFCFPFRSSSLSFSLFYSHHVLLSWKAPQ